MALMAAAMALLASAILPNRDHGLTKRSLSGVTPAVIQPRSSRKQGSLAANNNDSSAHAAALSRCLGCRRPPARRCARCRQHALPLQAGSDVRRHHGMLALLQQLDESLGVPLLVGCVHLVKSCDARGGLRQEAPVNLRGQRCQPACIGGGSGHHRPTAAAALRCCMPGQQPPPSKGSDGVAGTVLLPAAAAAAWSLWEHPTRTCAEPGGSGHAAAIASGQRQQISKKRQCPKFAPPLNEAASASVRPTFKSQQQY